MSLTEITVAPLRRKLSAASYPCVVRLLDTSHGTEGAPTLETWTLYAAPSDEDITGIYDTAGVIAVFAGATSHRFAVELA